MLELDASRRWCRAVMREHAKSFFFSTRVLPRRKREAVEALYALCRTADDAADVPGPSPAERRAILESIARDVAALREAGHHSSAPWYPAAADAFARFPIALADVQRLVAGCASDLDGRAIATMADLEAYASEVAGTVGRASMPILGANDPDSLQRGERLGIAMQLTNILRDVDEDGELGRNYLPLAEFPELSTGEVAQRIAQRARTLYREAEVLARRVPNDGSRAALIVTCSTYAGILGKIERRGFARGLDRAYVSTGEKLYLAARSLISAYAGFATIK